MSGHSKSTNIKHKKECNDTAEGRIPTVIDREIAVAVKEGGADSANSSKLKDVITKTKANNISDDTIDRGIRKAAGDTNSVDYETLTYERYDPNSVVIIMDTLADNKDHMATNVRSTFTKDGGNVDTPGNVPYMFDKEGQIIIDKGECGMGPDELMMLVLGTGVEDFFEKENNYEVITAPEDFNAIREVLRAQSIPMIQTGVTMIPQAWVELTDGDDTKRLDRTLSLLDEGDNIQVVYHNWDE